MISKSNAFREKEDKSAQVENTEQIFLKGGENFAPDFSALTAQYVILPQKILSEIQ